MGYESKLKLWFVSITHVHTFVPCGTFTNDSISQLLSPSWTFGINL